MMASIPFLLIAGGTLDDSSQGRMGAGNNPIDDCSPPPQNASMTKGQFKKPVRIQLGRIDRDRFVMGPKDAAEILLREWPLENSPSRTKAMEACLLVIRRHKPPSYSRRYFVAACKEARILLEDT
ncbi:DUF982 domain-containing protein [Aminobacter carboxidus]